jgi:hypothetical protein
MRTQSTARLLEEYRFPEIPALELHARTDNAVLHGHRRLGAQPHSRQDERPLPGNSAPGVDHHPIARNALDIHLGTDFDSGRGGYSDAALQQLIDDFHIFKSDTRWNSLSLPVTSTASRNKACAASGYNTGYARFLHGKSGQSDLIQCHIRSQLGKADQFCKSLEGD